MFFLLRMAFWIGVVLVLLPTGKTQDESAQAPPQVGTTEAVTAATAAVFDLSQFCVRQPTACEIGGQAASVISHRAQAGARKVFEFISEQADKSSKTELKPESKPDLLPEKSESRSEPKVETKAAVKHEPRPEKKPVKAAKKNPDQTGSIGEHAAMSGDGVPAFDNSTLRGVHAPWPISGVDSVEAPLLP